MTPIPKAALPVVRVLRRDVKRPGRLPRIGQYDGLRWRGRYCPMGLHKDSDSVVPERAEAFAGGSCEDDAVEEFYLWWDSLPASDARAAVDAVWPKRKARKR